jgi:hypothetical protein
MVKVFFSYSQADEQLVRQVAEPLKNHYDVFFASESISAGQSFQSAISEELKNTDVIIYMLTENSVKSKWVNMEIGIAIGYLQQKGKPLVIPVVFDDVSLPPQLLNIQSLFGRRDDIQLVTDKIIHAITYWIGSYQAKKDKNIELQSNVKENASIYIEESLKELRHKERQFYKVAVLWYITSFVLLFVGIGLPFSRIFKPLPHDMMEIISSITFSLILIALLTALARFSFILGKSYMVESLRNSDRLHAISFGKFYLNAFGQDAEWPEIKEAFQHWNIDKGSSFIKQEVKDFDPEIMKMINKIADAISSKINKN